MHAEETVTHSAARPGLRQYALRMLVRSLSSSLPLISLPAIAAESSSVTGITGVGPAMFLFLTALALFLSLLLRHAAGRLAQLLLRKLRRYRIERQLRRKGRALLKDVIVPGAYGGLARIDYALLTSGGIFCIRTIHGDGVVFGDQDDAQWTHVDGIGRRRFSQSAHPERRTAPRTRQHCPRSPDRQSRCVYGQGRISGHAARKRHSPTRLGPLSRETRIWPEQSRRLGRTVDEPQSRGPERRRKPPGF